MKSLYHIITLNLVLFSLFSCNKNNAIQNNTKQIYSYENLDFGQLSVAKVEAFKSQELEKNIIVEKDYFVWGSSVIELNGQYHAYYSRWKQADKFKAWMTDCEIVHAVSDHPEGPFTFQNVVLESDKTKGWDLNNAHNPYAIVAEGKIHLYYISNDVRKHFTDDKGNVTVPNAKWLNDNRSVLRNSQRIGLATAEKPEGPFIRTEEPVVNPDDKKFKNIAVNPSVAFHNGQYTMIMKGDDVNKKGWFRIQLVGTSTSANGPFEFSEKPVYDKVQTEDACIWYDQNVESYFMVCHVMGKKDLALFTSQNGTDWVMHQRSIFMKKEFELEDGTTWTPERVERPFVLTDKTGKPKVLYVAVIENGVSGNIALPIHFEKKTNNEISK